MDDRLITMSYSNEDKSNLQVESTDLRFLSSDELQALKIAICQSEGLNIEQCEEKAHLTNHFHSHESNFMMYLTGEESVCLAWVGDEQSFVNDYVHEEIHRILHKRIDLRSCCDYDNIARVAEMEMVNLIAHV